MMKVFTLIRINPLLWLIALIGVVTGHFREFLIFFLVILIHELGHALAAIFFKWRLVKVELLPFGGVAEMDEYGNRPYHEEVIVTVAGPIQHVWMIALGITGLSSGIGDPYLLELIIAMNWMILLFNLLPIWPLDGGKLLFLLLTLFSPYKKAKKSMLMLSCGFLLIFAVVSFIWFSVHLNLLIILSFLLYAHYVEWKHQPYMYIRFLLERMTGKEKAKRNKIITVQPTTTVENVLSGLYKGCNHDILIKSAPPYMCKEKDILTAYFKQSAGTCAIKDLFR
ncbi:M50 family metallopeptidase [Pseudalkalibacillus sp. A8]|uniref:M50 family metallopeptidase n=1 Tax=Pseudalkalibacillus sp. A8 TaxID=3382641 RepID=UPI0038B6703B